MIKVEKIKIRVWQGPKKSFTKAKNGFKRRKIWLERKESRPKMTQNIPEETEIIWGCLVDSMCIF